MCLYEPLLQSFVSLWIHWCVPSLSPRQVTLTQATRRRSHNFIASVFQIDLDMFCFPFLCCYQRALVNLSEKAIKQRRPTTMITIVTVNNQAKQDGVTVNTEIGGGRLFALLRHFPAHLNFFFFSFFCAFSIRLLMHSKLSAAYAVRQYAQCGSGTYADSPGSFREAGCCLLAALSQVGTVCTLSLWGGKRLAMQGGGLNTGGRGKLDVVFQG